MNYCKSFKISIEQFDLEKFLNSDRLNFNGVLK